MCHISSVHAHSQNEFQSFKMNLFFVINFPLSLSFGLTWQESCEICNDLVFTTSGFGIKFYSNSSILGSSVSQSGGEINKKE